MMLFIGMLGASETALGQFQARSVEGVVRDTLRQPVSGVSVRLSSILDTLITVTDDAGRFFFQDVLAQDFRLTFSTLGYEVLDRSYLIGSSYNVIHILPVTLYPQSMSISAVEINRLRPMVLRGDTIQYNLEAYNFRKNTLLETVLKSLPDIHVLRDGTVFTHGKRVSGVKVDGKDFFGGDVLIATQNLPVDLIKTIEVIDVYSESDAATGFKNSEPERVLNLTFHEDKKKVLFGQVTGGGGSMERYIGSFGIFNFNDGQELSLITSANNTNTSLFSFGSPSGEGSRQRDLTDLTGMTDPIDGINTVQSIGFNFSDYLSDRVEIYAKYSFTNRDNATRTDQFLRSGFETHAIENLESRETVSSQKSHNMTWDVKVNAGENRFFKISPRLTYQTSESLANSVKALRTGFVSSEGEYSVDSRFDSPTLGADLIYVHGFRNARRKLVFDGRMELSETDRTELIGDYFVSIDSTYLQPTIDIYSLLQENHSLHSNRFGKLSASYVEPIHRKGELELRYEYEYTSIGSNREIWDVELAQSIDSLGVEYDYAFRSHRYGAAYKAEFKRLYYSFGLALQPLELEGSTLDRDIRTSYRHLNWIPTFNLRYRLSPGSLLSMNYTGSNRQPGYMQMQPVRDLSNSQHMVIGNPDLQAEFSNRYQARMLFIPSNGMQSFDLNLEFNDVQRKIVTHRKTVPGTTAIETRYLNDDGYYDLRAHYTFSTRLGTDLLSLGISGAGDFINNISYADEARNVSKHVIYSQKAQIRYSQEDVLDLELSGNYLMNRANSSLRSMGEIRANSLLLGVAGRAYLGDHWTVGFDVSRRTYAGYSSYVEANPTLFNAYLEYTFLPDDRALLRFQGTDILNQGTGVTKEVYDGMDLSVRNNRLGQYFLVSLNIRFRRMPTSS